MRRRIEISKSSYITGLRCVKALHNKFHNQHLIQNNNTDNFLMAAGLEFESSARKLIAPDGVDITDGFKEMNIPLFCELTKKELKKTKVNIYQATFQTTTGERILADVIRKTKGKIDLIELKAVTKLQDYHYYDVAYQYSCIEKSGYKIDRVFIGHVNKEYVRNRELTEDLVTLFDVTKKVKQIQKTIPERIKYFKQVINSKVTPTNTIGFHCTDPYPCPYKDSCWSFLPKNNVFEIAGMHTKEKMHLHWAGKTKMEDIYNSKCRLNGNQEIQVKSTLNNSIIFEKEKIKDWLNQFVNKTLHYLDFETMGLATPLFDKGSCYQPIPVQFSIHQKNEKGILTHFEFLADPKSTDFRLDLTEKLIELLGKNNKEPIICFSKSFEAGRIRYLSIAFPKYRTQLDQILDRLYDLADVFKYKWYYHYDFKGSYSIKKVLPVLCPELSYDSLAVRNGSQASYEFLKLMRDGNCEKTRKQLLEYCKLDTYAMLRIMESLEIMVKQSNKKKNANTINDK